MRKLACVLLISAGCTAITDFAGYRFSAVEDLAVIIPGGDGGSDAAPNADLSGGDAANPDRRDLALPACPGGVECCPSVPCAGGGCCISGTCYASGSDVQANMACVDGQTVPCGTPGAFCCGENVCHNNGCCVGGRCFANSSGVPPPSMCPGTLGACTSGACVGITSTCGGQGDSCCPGGGNNADFCSQSGMVCVNNKCEQCAILPGGVYCCAGNWCPSGGCCDNSTLTCVNSGDQCSNGQGLCMNGGCDNGDCGTLGAPCCNNGVACTAPLTRCTLNGICDGCGGLDERCCVGSACAEGYSCDSVDKCRHCGNQNQLCCPGRVCATNLSCNGSNLCL